MDLSGKKNEEMDKIDIKNAPYVNRIGIYFTLPPKRVYNRERYIREQYIRENMVY